MPRICYFLDLKDDPLLIAEYDKYHEPGNVWPEIIADIKAQGYRDMEIWRCDNRLVMVAEVEEGFPHADRSQEVQNIVDRWETLMSNFQQRLPNASGDEKWIPAIPIFALKDH